MITKIASLSKSKFVRNVATVATGTAGAQAISIAFSPIITRLYGPDSFGLLGVFMALVAVLAPLAALTYPIAIVLPKEDSDARALGWLSFYIAFSMMFTLPGETHFLELVSYLHDFVYLRFKYGTPKLISE